ncbi:MAG: hypothetical protein ABR497_05005, partial [Kiritimatiellia bacterium]
MREIQWFGKIFWLLVVLMKICCGLETCLGAGEESVASLAPEPDPTMARDGMPPTVDVRHWRSIPVPPAFRAVTNINDRELVYGGDVRIGDLRNQQMMDFIVYRADPLETKRGKTGCAKPVFIGAFDQEGNEIWSHGAGGVQPARPGAVAIHDIDGDGRVEVIHFWKDPDFDAAPDTLG